jgi:hypothetical protein
VQHWQAVHRFVRDHKMPTVFPQYTLAPLATADTFCLAAFEFLKEVHTDPRYAGKKIVHAGDSAGGWMVLRLLEMMCGISLGEERGEMGDEEREIARSMTRRMGMGIMISPLVNFELTDELRRKESQVGLVRSISSER